MGRSTGVSLFEVLFLVCSLAAGQGMPLSTLTGKVTSEDGTPMAQIEVSVVSPDLQGHRRALTSPAGDYFFDLLPPGDYRVTFSRPGIQPIEREIRVTAAGSFRLDVRLRPETVKESVAVSAEAQSAGPVGKIEVAANYSARLVNALPIDRTLRSVVLLAPGVNENGPKGNIGSANERPAIMISGAPSYDNLFLVNGVVVNENLRGQPQDLFIEDAIQETTVLTGRISAEYGRFTGGVVNVITRSGGNDLHGSFRTTFTNDRWTANDPYNESLGLDPRVDRLSETYEETLGGPLWRDRLWFFTAGRQAKLSDSRTTRPTTLSGDIDPTPIAYVHTTDERRLEGKLTAAISPSHSLIASYIDVHGDETNYAFNQNILDTASLISRSTPNSLLALSYNGVLSDKLFAEAQYSRKRFTIEQGSRIIEDLIGGTRIFDGMRNAAGWNSPQAPLRTPQLYDNDSWLAKGSYFLSRPRFGSHDLRAGFERFTESATADNYFTGSDFRIFEGGAIIRGTQLFPSFRNDGTTDIRWHPISEQSQGTRLVTNSFFINDHVAWGKHWSLNVGLRYDANNDTDSRGLIVSRTHSWSPRLAARYDPHGDGQFAIDVGYGKYVAKIHDNLANASSPAGYAADLRWFYRGPCINCDVNLPTDRLIPTDQALRMLFDWFSSVGGVQSTPTESARVPGVSTRIAEGGLKSPSVREYSLGAGAALGQRGYVKADFLYRNFDDLYSSRIDPSTGKATDQFGNVLDVAQIENSNRLDRRYTGVQTQIQYRLGTNGYAGGSYTWSRLTGNFVGESRAVSATAGDIEQYPEYKQERWNFPTGYLSLRGNPGQGNAGQTGGDQRHRARIWVGWDFTVGSAALGAALLESYDSGLAYEAVGTIDPRYVANPGYSLPPANVAYFFTSPAAYRTDDITRTDIAINCAIRLFKSLELFIRPEVLNVLNERGVVAVDATVLTAATDPSGFDRFNPFTDRPVRGPRGSGANYDLDTHFGKPTSSTSYQLPRTFRFGIGLRF